MRRGVPGHATCPGMIVSWDEGAMSPDRILSGDTPCRPDRGCRWDSAVSQDGWHCPGTRLCPRRGGVPRRELSWDARAVPGQRGGVSDARLWRAVGVPG